MTTSDNTPAVVFKDPPKARRHRKALGSRIFNDQVREAFKAQPGTWGVFHTAGYAVPTKRWADENPGFKFHVVNVTERNDEGEFIGDERVFEVYGCYVGENGEYEKADDEQAPEQSEQADPEQADDNFSPAIEV